MVALILTMKTATVATAITFVLGIKMAYVVKGMRRWKGIADALMMMPLVMPPTVAGFFLLMILGKRGLDMNVVFTWKAAVITAVVESMPLMYRATLGSLEQIDENIIAAGRTLGLSEWKIFYRVMLPNIKGGLLAGLVLSYTRAMGEFGATIMLAGNIPGETQTLSTAIYAAVQGNDYETAYRLASVLMMMSLIFICAMNKVVKR